MGGMVGIKMSQIYRYFFLFLFFITICFFSVLSKSRGGVSAFENRQLTEWTKITDTKNVEKYISDHLPLREKLLTIYFSLNLKLSAINQAVIEGKDGWFFKGENNTVYNLPAIPSFQNKKVLSEAQHLQIISNLQKVQAYCDENNIKFYLMFPPDKHRIYAQFMPNGILRHKNLSPKKQLTSLLPENIRLIPLEQNMIDEAKKNLYLTYYKEESHWNENGAFFAYQQLMKEIKKDFPEVNILFKEDFVIKKEKVWNVYNVSNKPNFFNGNQYQPKYGLKPNLYDHFIYKKQNDIKVDWRGNFRSSVNKSGNPLSVYIVGDSFACYIHPFLSATFRRVRSHRFNMPREVWGIKFNERKKEFEQEKPDILIFSISDLKIKDLLKVD